MQTIINSTIGEPYRFDTGETIRLDKSTLRVLGLSPQDTVRVESGGRATEATVWRKDRGDWKDGTVRLSPDALWALNADPGDEVDIKPV